MSTKKDAPEAEAYQPTKPKVADDGTKYREWYSVRPGFLFALAVVIAIYIVLAVIN